MVGRGALWVPRLDMFYREEYNWQLLACLMTAAKRGPGASYMCSTLVVLSWRVPYSNIGEILDGAPVHMGVVEQPHVVAFNGRS